jgi:hypothetical protein
MNQVEVTLKMPAPFYRVLEAAAKADRMSVHGKIMRELVASLDGDLAQTEGLKEKLGIEKRGKEWSYQTQLRKLAGVRQTALWAT